MIKRIIPILIILLIAFSSCVKTVTRACTCKDAYGQVMSTETHSGDKKSAQDFEDKCKKKAIRSSKTVNSVTTSTIVPCEIS